MRSKQLAIKKILSNLPFELKPDHKKMNTIQYSVKQNSPAKLPGYFELII